MPVDEEKALTGLPDQALERFTKPFNRFLTLHAASGGVLLVFTVAAVALSNSPWGNSFLGFWETEAGLSVGTFELSRSLRHWINDGLMTVFFFLVALELKRELVLGELNTPRAAAFSIVGALGGMLIPAGLYLALAGDGPARHGWGLVMATDTAFVVAALALLGSRIPQSLRMFMLSLAVVDDVGAILVVAIGYSGTISGIPLAVAAAGIAGIKLMEILGFRHFSNYILVGIVIWLAVDASGIHPTITGVILGLLTPAQRWVNDQRLHAILRQVVAHPSGTEDAGATKDRQTLLLAEIAAREALSPIERLEMTLHPWVSFVIMPVFAFANAGLPVTWDVVDIQITLAVVCGLVIGKPVGIIAFSWLAVRAGLAARPEGLNWTLTAGGCLLAGIGFTMSLLIADLAMPSSLLDSAKVGIFIASILAAVSGISVLAWATRSRR